MPHVYGHPPSEPTFAGPGPTFGRRQDVRRTDGLMQLQSRGVRAPLPRRSPRRVGPPIGTFMTRAEANSALAARGGGGHVVRSPATGLWQIEGFAFAPARPRVSPGIAAPPRPDLRTAPTRPAFRRRTQPGFRSPPGAPPSTPYSR